MKRVQQVPKDIDLIVYRFIHRDLMDQLNSEYHKKVEVCNCKGLDQCENGICTSCIHVKTVTVSYAVAYNYRRLCTRYHYYHCINNIYDLATNKRLPENY